MKKLLLLSLASIALLTGASAFARCRIGCGPRACPTACPRVCAPRCAKPCPPLTQCKPCPPVCKREVVPVDVYREVVTTVEAGPCFCECPTTDAIFANGGQGQAAVVEKAQYGYGRRGRGRRMRAAAQVNGNNGYIAEETTAVVE